MPQQGPKHGCKEERIEGKIPSWRQRTIIIISEDVHLDRDFINLHVQIYDQNT